MTEQPNQQQENKQAETEEMTAFISGEYLSAACHMVAWQFIDAPPIDDPKTFTELAEQSAKLLQQHTPVAYRYFNENNHSAKALPDGTTEIIRTYVLKHRKGFMGGEANGRKIVLA